jgi:hypothetical protein
MSSQQQARTNGEPPTDDAASLASAAADDMELGEAQEEDGPEPVGEPDYEAPQLSAAAAAGGALFATIVLAGSALLAIAPAGFGAGLLVLGVFQGSDRGVFAGSALLFGGLVLGGVQGARPPALLLAAVGVAIAYDAGQYAVTLGTQLRAGAPTHRAELVHVGATATVVTATAGVGALVFRVGAGGQPSTALVALLLATVLFVWALLR